MALGLPLTLTWTSNRTPTLIPTLTITPEQVREFEERTRMQHAKLDEVVEGINPNPNPDPGPDPDPNPNPDPKAANPSWPYELH